MPEGTQYDPLDPRVLSVVGSGWDRGGVFATTGGGLEVRGRSGVPTAQVAGGQAPFFPNGGWMSDATAATGTYSTWFEFLPTRPVTNGKVQIANVLYGGTSGNRTYETPNSAPMTATVAFRFPLRVLKVGAVNTGDGVTLTVTNPDGTAAGLQTNEYAGAYVVLPSSPAGVNHQSKGIASNTATTIVVSTAYVTTFPAVGDELVVYSPSRFATWGGATSVTVAAGARATSDALPLLKAPTPVVIGATAAKRAYGLLIGAFYDAGAGANVPKMLVYTPLWSEYNNSDRVTSGGSSAFAASYYVTQPVNALSIVGTSPVPIPERIGILGNSIEYSTNGAQVRRSGLVRALEGMGAVVDNVSCAGERLSTFAGGGAAMRLAQLRAEGCTTLVLGNARNDLGVSSPSVILGYYQTLAALAKAAGFSRVYATTTPPATSSTDGWATTANQTPDSTNADRVALNTALRASFAQYGLTGTLDPCAVWESSLNSGLWVPTMNSLSDGGTSIHPSEKGHAALGYLLDVTALQP